MPDEVTPMNVFSKNDNNRFRAILDSGSNANCLLNEYTETLGLKKNMINFLVSSLTGSTQIMEVKTSSVISNADDILKRK